MTAAGDWSSRRPGPRSSFPLLLGCLLLCVGVAWRSSSSAAAQLVPLGTADWARNGEPVPDLEREEVDGEARVRLPFDGMGVRWSTVFRTEGAATRRLFLSWDPGPDGLLFEVLLDGERQPPPRDGWRPTSRHLVSDLGPRWLGDGEHLLEFISREKVERGALALRSLELRPPSD